MRFPWGLPRISASRTEVKARAWGVSISMVPMHGTIVVGKRLKGSVVIAADQRWCGTDENGQFKWGSGCKIVFHSKRRIPLMFATSGMRDLYRGESADLSSSLRPRDILRQSFNEINGFDNLKEKNILKIIESSLFYLVRNTRHLLLPIEPDCTNLFLDVIVAFVRRGKADLLTVRMNDGIKPTVNRPSTLHSPYSLEDFYNNVLFKDSLFSKGIHNHDYKVVATHLHDAVMRGIAEEARINGGENRQCGGPVDVAVVDSNGCRPIKF